MSKLMSAKIVFCLIFWMFCQLLQARDFEGSYAVYGAGAESCKNYVRAMQKGGREEDFFIDWSIGYLTAFNVIMPNTHNILGETSFSDAQLWLQRRCKKYPNELFINAFIRLTEVLFPMRYQSSLKPTEPAKSGPKKSGQKESGQKKTATGKSSQKKSDQKKSP